jgi:hypothetical protein
MTKEKKQAGLLDRRQEGKSNNETFTWSQINTALMNTGVKPWRIADILYKFSCASKARAGNHIVI